MTTERLQSCCRKTSRDEAVADLEAAALLVAASGPGDPEATDAYGAAVQAATEAGLTPEEIREISTECTDLLGDLIVSLTQLGAIHVEGLGSLVPSEKARRATAGEWKRVHAKYAPKPKIEA